MAKPKQVGYVELEWTCPTCGTRSGGRTMVCPGCGAPQPANAKFEAPTQGKVVGLDDPEAAQVKARVAAGPDVQCPFCGARNAATAGACVQCHAPLQGATARAAGANLGALATDAPAEVSCHVCGAKNTGAAHMCAKCGAPLQQRAGAAQGMPQPVAAKRGFAAVWWIWALGALLVVGIGLFAWLSSRSSDLTAVVTGGEWERSIEVLGFVPVEQRAWRSDVPDGATLLACSDELFETLDEAVPGAVEVCGTPYTVDTGTGYGNVVQDCEYQVFAPRCTYTSNAWVVVDTLTASGDDLLPQWPLLARAADGEDRKEGERSESFHCTAQVDGDSYTFRLSSENYAYCVPQSRWRVEVNGLGAVVDATPLGK